MLGTPNCFLTELDDDQRVLTDESAQVRRTKAPRGKSSEFCEAGAQREISHRRQRTLPNHDQAITAATAESPHRSAIGPDAQLASGCRRFQPTASGFTARCDQRAASVGRKRQRQHHGLDWSGEYNGSYRGI